MSVVCRRANASDRAALIALWMQAFGDAKEDVVHFLDTFDDARTAFVLCENDMVRSMLFLIPTDVLYGERCFPSGYVYAGATHPDARGKGHYRRLLEYAAQTAAQMGMRALLLRPATDSLAASYRRMGFTTPLYGNAATGTDRHLHETLSAQEYGAKRRELLRGQAFVDWDDRAIAYALSWCKAGKEDAFLVLRDADTVWECLPAATQNETALLMPLDEGFQTSAPIWFGYGLE